MIRITGDTHGRIDIAKLDELAEQHPEMTKDDYVIITGDVAVPWKTPYKGHINKSDKNLIKHYNAYPWTTLFIDGNHENFNALHQFPIEMWNGGKVHRIGDSLLHLMRGQVFTIDGYTFFTLGGAESIDAATRIPGKSWWREETISYSDMDIAAENLEKVNFKVDFVLTHDMPADLFEKYFLLIKDRWEPSSTPRSLSTIYNNVDYKRWFFGHHHVDITDDKHIGLYNQIICLDDYNDDVEENKFFCYLT